MSLRTRNLQLFMRAIRKSDEKSDLLRTVPTEYRRLKADDKTKGATTGLRRIIQAEINTGS